MFRRIVKMCMALATLLVPFASSAHEVYVLSHDKVVEGLANGNIGFFDPLKNLEDVSTFVFIGSVVVVGLVVFLFLRRTRLGLKIENQLNRLARFGPVIVRVAVGISFIYGSVSGAFLGPELSLSAYPLASVLTVLLFIAGVFITVGLFTEYVALLGVLMYLFSFWKFGSYMFSYVNYAGELLLLLLLGSRQYSLDSLFFNKRERFISLKRFEPTVLRVAYGLALAYAAVYIKFLHPALTLEVVNRYNLTQFHFLFPHDPLLVVLGAGCAELMIGLFLIIGFEVRLVVFISLIYLTLSLLFFQEAVWPHLILFGISFYLLFVPSRYGLDQLIEKRLKNSL